MFMYIFVGLMCVIAIGGGVFACWIDYGKNDDSKEDKDMSDDTSENDDK